MMTVEFTIKLIGTGCDEEKAYIDACEAFEKDWGEPHNSEVVEDTGEEDC